MFSANDLPRIRFISPQKWTRPRTLQFSWQNEDGEMGDAAGKGRGAGSPHHPIHSPSFRLHRPADQAAELAPENIGIKRLQKIVRNPRLDGFDHMLAVRLGGNHENRHLRARKTDRTREIQSGHTGHLPIEHHGVKSMLVEQCAGLLPIRRFEDFQVVRPSARARSPWLG